MKDMLAQLNDFFSFFFFFLVQRISISEGLRMQASLARELKSSSHWTKNELEQILRDGPQGSEFQARSVLFFKQKCNRKTPFHFPLPLSPLLALFVKQSFSGTLSLSLSLLILYSRIKIGSSVNTPDPLNNQLFDFARI